MPAQQQHWIRSAYLSGATGPVAAGYALVSNGTRYVVATSANRASYGRAEGIAITSGDNDDTQIEIQSAGTVPNSITGLGAGVATWVIVSATGSLERDETPDVGDDVIGRCNARGDVAVAPFVWDSTNVSPGATPTGTGFTHITAGVQDAAAKLVENADVAAAAAIAVTKLAAGAADTVLKGGASNAFGKVVNADIDAAAAIALSKTALSANAQAFLATPTSANLAALVTDETGTGALVLGTQPTLDRPVINEIEHATGHSVSINGDGVVQWGAGGVIFGVPRLGVAGAGTYGGVSFPAGTSYSSEGYLQLNISNAGGTHFTVDAATYSRTCIDFRSATGARSVYFPLPASGDAAYAKDLINESGFTVTVCVNDAQPSALATATLATGAKGRFWFTAAGVFGPIARSSFSDSAFEITDDADATKIAKFQCSGIATATTRTLTVPDADDTVAVLGLAQTMTNKTVSGPSFSASSHFAGPGTVATAGAFRVAGGFNVISNVGGTNRPILEATAGAEVIMGGFAASECVGIYERISTGGTWRVQMAGANNIIVTEAGTQFGAAAADFGDGVGVIGIDNATTVPTTNPTGGAIWYAEGGASKARGSSGTVTTFAAAEPHCPRCGTDAGIALAVNDLFGEEIMHCKRCEKRTGNGVVVDVANIFERKKVA